MNIATCCMCRAHPAVCKCLPQPNHKVVVGLHHALLLHVIKNVHLDTQE